MCVDAPFVKLTTVTSSPLEVWTPSEPAQWVKSCGCALTTRMRMPAAAVKSTEAPGAGPPAGSAQSGPSNSREKSAAAVHS